MTGKGLITVIDIKLSGRTGNGSSIRP